MKNLLDICVLAELEIIQRELTLVGVQVPVKVIGTWKLCTRARVEQWAIRKRWSRMQCLPKFAKVLPPGRMPNVIKQWSAPSVT